jgi:hypothetical protein
VHGTQSIKDIPPLIERNVPSGQGTGDAVPSGQKCPGGHRSPSRVSIGVLVDELVTQKYPGAHIPDGSVIPDLAQYIPAVHGWHDEALARPVWLLNVPIGHGVSFIKDPSMQ